MDLQSSHPGRARGQAAGGVRIDGDSAWDTRLEYLDEWMACANGHRFDNGTSANAGQVGSEARCRYDWIRGPHLRAVLSCFVRTKLSTYMRSGRSSEESGVSMARTGEMVLNGVWLRKNMVQSSRCRSAPSGSIRLARRLLVGDQ